MKPPNFRSLVDDYLTLRRDLGFDVESAGWRLRDFARYADRIGHRGAINVDLAVGWALSDGGGAPERAERRLGAIRQFARHRAAFDPATEIPPAGLFGRVPRRRRAHIYSDAEISALLRGCSLLQPRGGLRPRTYVAFFSLLASTGLRLSEACRLQCRDVDLRNGLLTVRVSKFRKSRLVPLHRTAVQALARYVVQRDAFLGASRSESFFRTDHALALQRAAVEKTFSRLRDRLGWTSHGRARRPRIHDLRHTFAVRQLLCWYEEGADPGRKMLALSTYLGHARVTDTYWYLTAVPELMAITSRRFEHYALAERESES